jgi:AmmeMemoRadiSam system protein B
VTGHEGQAAGSRRPERNKKQEARKKQEEKQEPGGKKEKPGDLFCILHQEVLMRKSWWSILALLCLILAGCRGGKLVATPGPTYPPELVRRPAFAGQFYPLDAEKLTAEIDGYMAGIEPTAGRPLALIVPHAGYMFSGPVAGYSYAEVRGEQYEAIILIGQNHYLQDFTGVAIYPGGAWETPLGMVPVHTELAEAILQANPAFERDPARHAQDHCLEVELPFLQRALPGTPIVPILIGYPYPQNTQALIEALRQVLAGRDVLLIASSDLSHYPAYHDAVRVDRTILAAIETLDPAQLRQTVTAEMAQGVPNLVTTCCGEEAIVVVMEVAKALGATRATVLHYANSGDVPGADRARVVGYGAVKIAK